MVLVPGDGGSQIEARLNKTSGHWWCAKTSDWYDLWLNINQMLQPEVQCWSDNVALQYDPATHTTRSVSSLTFLSSNFLSTATPQGWRPGYRASVPPASPSSGLTRA